MFLLLLLLIFNLLTSAHSSNCEDIPFRKPPRFGKRFGSELMQRMKQAHPCVNALERRSNLAPNLADYIEQTQMDKQQEVLISEPHRADSDQEDRVPAGLLLKVYSILRQQNAD